MIDITNRSRKSFSDAAPRLGLAIVLLAFALRAWGLGDRALWFDEAVEYRVASGPLASIAPAVRGTYQPPLYSYLLRLWMAFGISPFWLRYLSVMLSVLAVAAGIALAQRMAGAPAGLLAGLILALLPSQIRFAQEVGEYALMSGALAWSLVYLQRAGRRPAWRNWLLWTGCSVAAILSQYGAALVIGALAAVTLIENLLRRSWRAAGRQTASALAGVALAAPVLWYFFLPQLRSQQAAGAGVAFELPARQVGRWLIGAGETIGYQLTLIPFSTLPRWPAYLVAAGIVIVATLMATGRGQPRGYRQAGLWFLAAFLTYLTAVGLGLYGYGTYGLRYSLILALPLAVAAAAGAGYLARRRLAAMGALLTLALLVPAGAQSAQGAGAWPETREQLGAVMADCWLKDGGAGAPTYVYYGAWPAFEYYRDLYGIRPAAAVHGEWFRGRPLRDKIAAIESAFDGHPQRFWLLFSHITVGEDQELLSALSARYTPRVSCRQQDASAYLLERRQ